MEVVEQAPYRFVIPRHGRMRVPGVVYATRALLPDLAGDRSLEQVVNVAALPGIVEASYAMPDIHWGYGFPIGGVAATDIAAGGVISPGGVGFDICCGVRLLAADLSRAGLAPRLGAVMDALAAAIPRGSGPGGVWRLGGRAELEKVLAGGARYAVEQGHGSGRDLARCEDEGAAADAEPARVSQRAVDRGLRQDIARWAVSANRSRLRQPKTRRRVIYKLCLWTYENDSLFSEPDVAPTMRIDALSDTRDDPHADRQGAPFLGELTRDVSHKRRGAQ